MMNLKYDDIQAFLEIQKAGTFTKASHILGLSQSALSQKVARLEDSLQAALFVRHPRHLSLTATGDRLMIYAKEAVQRQQDFMASFDQYQSKLQGVIRIGGYSSIMRSMIIPKLAPWQREHPEVQIELRSYEVFELEDVLKSNQADLILTDYFPDLNQCEQVQVAEEEYVIIRAKKYKNIPNLFLDHGPFDNATESYFKHVGLKQDYERRFLGDVYSIIDGVAEGFGKAVMSKHLIEKDRRFAIEATKKRYLRPIVLSYFTQSYYSPIQQQVVSLLSS